jgi:dolichol-phosphate mannosyltransferase
MKDVVVIPTYNEKENIRDIVNQVTTLYPNFEVWIVDDNSPDGTASIVSDISAKNSKIRLYSRSGKTGLGDAYRFIHSKIKNDKSIRYVITMDADGSHDPRSIKDLINALSNHDLAVGSRYIRGGKIVGWGIVRFVLSYFGNIYSRIITGLPINDGTAGFVAFRRTIIDNIDFSSIPSAGYSYQIEFKNAVIQNGGKYCEVPITFTDRQVGKSKMSGHIVAEGLIMPWRILIKDRDAIYSRCRIVAFFLLFLLITFTATYKLTESPSVWYDEGIYSQMASNLYQNSIVGVRLSPNEILHVSEFSVGYPLIYPLAGVFSIFGVSVLSARLLMVLFIIGLAIVVYILIKRSFDANQALLTLALFATFAPLYGNGKSVLGEVPGLFFTILGFLFINLARTNDKSKKKYIFFAGISIGLAIVTKPIFILLIPALICGVFMQWRKNSFKMSNLSVGIISALIPFAVWIILQFRSGDSFIKMISFYANPYHVSNIVQVITNNLKNFITGMGPVYLLLISIVWFISIVIRSKRHINIPFEEFVSFIFSVLGTLAYLRTSGMYRYIFISQIVSLLYFPSALLFVIQAYLTNYRQMIARKLAVILPIIIFSVLIVFGTYQVFFDSSVADSYTSNKTFLWQSHFDQMSSTKSVFFYNTPEVAIFKKDNNYYQYMEPAIDMKIGNQQLNIIRKGLVDEIIIAKNYYEDLKSTQLFAKYNLSSDLYKYCILNRI